MDKQREKALKLFQLIQDNPDLKIVPMVESEVVAGDEFSYWLAGWGESSIDEMYIHKETVYFRSTDEDRLVEEIYDDLEIANPYMAPETLNSMTDQRLDELKWDKVIRVNITLPN